MKETRIKILTSDKLSDLQERVNDWIAADGRDILGVDLAVKTLHSVTQYIITVLYWYED